MMLIFGLYLVLSLSFGTFDFHSPTVVPESIYVMPCYFCAYLSFFTIPWEIFSIDNTFKSAMFQLDNFALLNVIRIISCTIDDDISHNLSAHLYTLPLIP